MQVGRLRTADLAIIVVSIGIWTAPTLMPTRLAVVPEYMAVLNAVFVVSLLSTLAVVSRILWIRMRWRSAPIVLVLICVALLAALGPADRFLAQTQPEPAEGFLYDDGWMYTTHVDRVLQDESNGDRLYVLQQYFLGHQARTAYRRQGHSPVMEKLESVPGGLRCISSSRRAAREC